ncbi:MAG: PQQ-dependent sugar dehydrogenase [Verrucomicrobiaceae bacterium]
MKHLFLACLLPGLSLADAKLPADEHFRVDEIATGFVDAMEITVAPQGYVFVIERTGAVKVVNPDSGEIKEIAQLDVEVREKEHARECGLLGITLDPAFATNKWLYLYYSPTGKAAHNLSRFTFTGSALTDEKVLLTVKQDPENGTCHEGGSLTFGPDGCLFLSTGDNTCPFKSDGSAPIDERDERKWYDAQRSAANTNDLRGKILRIKPTPDGSYTIPEGNLFPPGTDKTLPEIYVMGCRNPYRISVDQKNGILYWGKVGPDAGKDSKRGPRGYDEINQARQAGNFGWPYFSGDNKPYTDYDFETKKLGKPFNPQAPVNDSPNNTGLRKLPPAQPAFWFYPRASACAGPVFYKDQYPDSPTKLPDSFDSSLIVYDWTSNWIRVIRLDEKGDIVSNEPWLSKFRFVHLGDMEMSPKGELYILEYGSAWYDGNDGKLKRVTYSAEPQPIEVPANDPRMVGLPEGHPGSAMIGGSTCLACHMTKDKSIGPSYKDVAKKYKDDPKAIPTLAEKILSGGVGVWGQQPMPPHPQHNIEETQQMVEAILQVK